VDEIDEDGGKAVSIGAMLVQVVMPTSSDMRRFLESQKRDDLEDAELQTSQISEGMPMVVQGFKDHPL